MKYYNNKTSVIGVLGTSTGVGTTWVSLMLASYMSDIKNRKTCLYELSGKDDLSALSGRRKLTDSAELLRIMDIDIYCRADASDVLNAKNKKYDICIFDLGCADENIDELLRCDTKILVTSIAPWKISCKDIITKYAHEVENFDSWRLFVNFSRPEIRKYIGKLPLLTGFVPIESDPLRLSDNNIQFMRNMNF